MEITLYSISDYNAGHLISKTFDLDLIDSEEDYHEAIHEWLDDLSKQQNDGENREEWIVCDYEGIPSSLVSEYDLTPDFWEYKEALGCGLDPDVVKAWLDYGNSVDVEAIRDRYRGQWASDEEFVRQLLEDGDVIPSELPDYVCINWALTSEAVMVGGYFESNGHYFSIR